MRVSRAAVLVAMTVLLSTGCRHAVQVIDNAPKPPRSEGTISGRIVGPAGQALANRRVHAVNNDTRARFEATTNESGGFTMMVPPGTYHLDVVLERGEEVLDPPADLDVGKGDIDANVTLKVRPIAAR
jgi:hypothetical protein